MALSGFRPFGAGDGPVGFEERHLLGEVDLLDAFPITTASTRRSAPL